MKKAKNDAPFDVVGIGYNSVDYLYILDAYPNVGAKALINEYSIEGGGQTATACAALSKFGFSARYIGKFGSGETGELAEKSLNEWNVDTSKSMHTDVCPNQFASIWIDGKSGERTISYQRSPELCIHENELNKEDVTSGRVLLLDAHDIPAMVRAAKWANEADIPVVLDAERVLPGIDELLDLTDYIIADQTFPIKYTGEKDSRTALQKMSKHGHFIASTLGDQGSLAWMEGQLIQTPAIEIACVDSTGAGDVFHAGFAAGLLLGYDVERSLRLANASAGLKCRKLGGRRGIPTLEKAIETSDRLKNIKTG